MFTDPTTSLLDHLRHLTDPRKRRGVRHGFASALALVFLGLLCRKADFATIARWAKQHWPALRGPLGFTRTYAPHATTLGRIAAGFSLDEFQAALCGWFAGLPRDRAPTAAAVDGKTSRRGYDPDGDPVHMLNVFAHDLGACLASWPVGGGKDTEPAVLKAHLAELLAAWPSLRVLTGDALFCQRPLARVLIEHGRDYLLAIKDNQPDLHEAARATFAAAAGPTADATAVEKRGARWSPGGCGATPRRRSTPATR
jgi:hypothetical protein